MSVVTKTLKESLKRLYKAGKIKVEDLNERLKADPPKLDQEDFDYITDTQTA